MEEFVVVEGCLFRRLEAGGAFISRRRADKVGRQGTVHASEVLVKSVRTDERFPGRPRVTVSDLQGGTARMYASSTRVYRVRLFDKEDDN